MDEQHPPSATPNRSPESVLVVEDQAVVALELGAQLERLGYHVCGTVGSARAAIDAVRLHRPSIVVMDIRLDGKMDGLTAGEEIYVCDATPVVYLTAHAEAETLDRAARTGAYGYLTKPYSQAQVAATLALALNKHRELVQARTEHERTSSLLDTLEHAAIAARADGTVLKCNAAAKRFVREHQPLPQWLHALCAHERAATGLEWAAFTVDGTAVRVWGRCMSVGDEGMVLLLRETDGPSAQGKTP